MQYQKPTPQLRPKSLKTIHFFTEPGGGGVCARNVVPSCLQAPSATRPPCAPWPTASTTLLGATPPKAITEPTKSRSRPETPARPSAGADDYITKPFQLRELTARLRSAGRRRSAQDVNQDAVIRHGQLELDPVKYRLLKRGKPIHLTPKEFEVLHYLMMHAGEPIPHARLLKSVWGPEYGNELEYLRTFIRQLRKKIEDDPRNPYYLLTDAYVGYRFKEQSPTN